MKQKKVAHILCTIEQKVGPKIELFPAEQWKRSGAVEGLYRVRIDRKWYVANGDKFTFLTPDELGKLFVDKLKLAPALIRPRPNLQNKQRVSVRGPNGWTQAMTVSEPIQCIDGLWRILVRGYGFSDFYLCDEIRGINYE